jgi:hypothetical protein
VNGATDSQVFGGYLQTNGALGHAGDWRFGISGRASWVRQTQDAYTEEGNNPLRLTVSDIQADSLEVQGMLNAEGKFGGERGVTWNIEVGAEHLALQGDRNIDVAFATSNAPVVLQGDRRDSTQLALTTRVTHALTQRLLLSASYAGKFGEQDRHEARLGLSMDF